MKKNKAIALILAVMLLLSGCGKAKTDTKKSDNATATPTVTTAPTEPAEPTVTEEPASTDIDPDGETETEDFFEFNPHVYSAHLAESVPEDYWNALYNLCDALRVGETTFECASEEAYKWCTDVSVMCNYFPAAGLQIEAKSEDGSAAFENGIGKITYLMPVDDFVKRQAEFEDLIEEIINTNLEADDTDYEKALKLYVYMAENYTYEYEVQEIDNYVYKTFTLKTGQCINIAAVYSYLLLQVGVDAIAIGTYDGMAHAWSYVTINGKSYHIDPTWALLDPENGKCFVYLDYFMMSDEERIADGCGVDDLTVDILPGYWVNNGTVSYAATDNSYNLRDYTVYYTLNEETKTLYYVDVDGNTCEFHYDI